MLLENRVAVILGASAEGGTGWAIAERFAAEGARVIVAARSFDKLQILAARIGGAAIACDATRQDQVEALAAFALSTYGRLDIAINAAALPVAATIADCTAANLQAAIEADFFANVYFVKHMAQRMTSGGSIILFSSMNATHPQMPFMPYACAKAATDCLVRYAAIEYGPRGIKVNSILPGPILSDLGRQYFSIPGVTEAFTREIPLGRIGYVEDFADAALWLAGPSFITGVNLQVSGGNHLSRFPRPDELPDLGGGYAEVAPLHDRNKGDAT
jgi:NAD(P)-dependent dehydrogenase (short-subunit alcohol dehydrogenase family)